jgi:hypothetical protein
MAGFQQEKNLGGRSTANFVASGGSKGRRANIDARLAQNYEFPKPLFGETHVDHRHANRVAEAALSHVDYASENSDQRF